MVSSWLSCAPDGQTVEHGYLPEYPDQVADVSYGLSADGAEQGFFTVPTPGAPNALEPVDDPLRTIVINEIMYHPHSERVADEYIELFNRSDQAVNLQGWRFFEWRRLRISRRHAECERVPRRGRRRQ